MMGDVTSTALSLIAQHPPATGDLVLFGILAAWLFRIDRRLAVLIGMLKARGVLDAAGVPAE